MALNVGDVFATYDDFRDAVTKYEEATYVNYTVYDSTTVERGRKKQPKRTFWIRLSNVAYS